MLNSCNPNKDWERAKKELKDLDKMRISTEERIQGTFQNVKPKEKRWELEKRLKARTVAGSALKNVKKRIRAKVMEIKEIKDMIRGRIQKSVEKEKVLKEESADFLVSV